VISESKNLGSASIAVKERCEKWIFVRVDAKYWPKHRWQQESKFIGDEYCPKIKARGKCIFGWIWTVSAGNTYRPEPHMGRLNVRLKTCVDVISPIAWA
jgi:hypothetical protein